MDASSDSSVDTPRKVPSIGLTARIVSAFVSRNALPAEAVSGTIREVTAALRGLATPATSAPPARPEPAVPIKRSINPDYLVCLEDGKRFKSLKRHLRSQYNMSPAEYRARWNLPASYPMVAPNYAKSRSLLAKEMGLGLKRGLKRR